MTLTPLQLQQIRDYVRRTEPCDRYQDEMEDDPVTRYVCGKCDQQEVLHDLASLLTAYEEAQQQIAAWRQWAQFVYLGGGEVPEGMTDDALRQAVCEAQDVDVLKARQGAQERMSAQHKGEQ